MRSACSTYSCSDRLLPNPTNAGRRDLTEIKHMEKYDRSQFMDDDDLADWIKTRRHRVMYKDASKID